MSNISKAIKKIFPKKDKKNLIETSMRKNVSIVGSRQDKSAVDHSKIYHGIRNLWTINFNVYYSKRAGPLNQMQNLHGFRVII